MSYIIVIELDYKTSTLLGLDAKFLNHVHSRNELMNNLNPSKVVAVFPLGNFEMESTSIDLAEEVKIRKLSKNERLDKDHEIKLLEYPFGIEIETTEVDALENIPQFVLTALRLYKTGLVGFGTNCIVKERPPTITESEISSAVAHYISSPLEIYGSPYVLTGGEISSFKKFFTRLSTSKLDTSIVIAFWNFNKAMQAKETERQFLDFIITLETLYMREERGREKKSKLAKRVSSLLGRTKGDGEWIHNKIVDWYNYRNEILHSGHPSSKSLDKVNLVADCIPLEEIVRRSFRTLIALLQTHDKKALWKMLRRDPNDRPLMAKLQKEISFFYGCSFPYSHILISSMP